jgi:E3 ubiquitin-protein ligase TRIP12
VDDTTLEEYLELVLDRTVGSGVAEQVKAFQDGMSAGRPMTSATRVPPADDAGFSLIYPIRDMRIFSPEELVLLFGNADEDWSSESEPFSARTGWSHNRCFI